MVSLRRCLKDKRFWSEINLEAKQEHDLEVVDTKDLATLFLITEAFLSQILSLNRLETEFLQFRNKFFSSLNLKFLVVRHYILKMHNHLRNLTNEGMNRNHRFIMFFFFFFSFHNHTWIKDIHPMATQHVALSYKRKRGWRKEILVMLWCLSHSDPL